MRGARRALDRGAQDRGVLRREPPREPRAPRLGHLDQPAVAIERQARLDAQVQLVVLGLGRAHRQPGERAVPHQVGQSAGEPRTVVGLLVAEILGLEQHPGGVVDPLGRHARDQRVGGGQDVGWVGVAGHGLVLVTGGASGVWPGGGRWGG